MTVKKSSTNFSRFQIFDNRLLKSLSDLPRDKSGVHKLSVFQIHHI